MPTHKNQQAAIPAVDSSNWDGKYQVHGVFNTIQGEGPYTGRRATFIRLANCNLQCPLCDTLYTGNVVAMTALNLANLAVLTSKSELVVITGGEPMRQPLWDLCDMLLHRFEVVQIETNGTLYTPVPHEVQIVCSPKTETVHSQLAPLIAAYKYVLHHKHVNVVDGLPTIALANQLNGKLLARPPKGDSAEIYVQPCDSYNEEINKLNMAAAVKSCIEHGYTLCLQTHKIAGLE